jgi:chromosome partitioning protein
MRSIAIINQKGGVGKTTSAVNLAAALAQAGRRVCLMDLDPQAHASLHLGLALSEDDPSTYDVLTRGIELSRIRQQVADNLWVAPSHLNLAAAELELAAEMGRESMLRSKLAEDGEPFDFLILDCPPSLGVLTLNALTAVREVFLPLQPHFLALHGLSKLLRTIDVVSQRWNRDLRLSGVVICMYESGTRLAAEVCHDVDQFFLRQQDAGLAWRSARVFTTRIRRNIRLAEAPSHGQSIFQYAADSNGAQDYAALAREILAMPVPETVAVPASSAEQRR